MNDCGAGERRGIRDVCPTHPLTENLPTLGREGAPEHRADARAKLGASGFMD